MITVFPNKIDELPFDQLSPFHQLCKKSFEITRAKVRISHEMRSARRKAIETDRMLEEDLVVGFTSNPTAGLSVKLS